jgi:hypothetical protein
MTHKSEEISSFEGLVDLFWGMKSEDFSYSLDVLYAYGVLELIAIFDKKKYKKISAVNFFQFFKILDLDTDPHWPIMPDPDPHWNQRGSTTLISSLVLWELLWQLDFYQLIMVIFM